jgi:hypothetical protein
VTTTLLCFDSAAKTTPLSSVSAMSTTLRDIWQINPIFAPAVQKTIFYYLGGHLFFSIFSFLISTSQFIGKFWNNRWAVPAV